MRLKLYFKDFYYAFFAGCSTKKIRIYDTISIMMNKTKP